MGLEVGFHFPWRIIIQPRKETGGEGLSQAAPPQNRQSSIKQYTLDSDWKEKNPTER